LDKDKILSAKKGYTKALLLRNDLWKNSDTEKLIELWKSGSRAKEVAVELGKTKSAVENRIFLMRKKGFINKLSKEEFLQHNKKGIQEGKIRRYENAENYLENINHSKDYGYILGVLCGDGFITIMGDRGSIGIKTTNKSFRDSFCKCLESVFNKKTKKLERFENKTIGKYKYENVKYYEGFLHSVHIGKSLIKKFGEFKEDKWNIFNGIRKEESKEFLKGIAQGFFDSEGSIYKKDERRKAIDMSSKNKVGLDGIRKILEVLGIETKLYTGKKEFKLRIFKKLEIEKFINKIGSRIDRKKERMELAVVNWPKK